MAKSFDELVSRTTSKKVQARGAARARRYLAEMLLSELRKQHGMSQKRLAAALRIRQPSLSKLEGQDDMHISTLQKIIEALGGSLVIQARFPDGMPRLKQFDRKSTSARKARNRQIAA